MPDYVKKILSVQERAAGRRLHAGALLGYGTLAATVALFAVGWFSLPRPYHRRVQGPITAVVSAYRPGDGLDVVVATASGIPGRPHRFTAHLAGAVPVECPGQFLTREIVLGGIRLSPAPGVPRDQDVYAATRLRDGADVSRLLVEAGCAYASSNNLKGAEDDARSHLRGIWGTTK